MTRIDDHEVQGTRLVLVLSRMDGVGRVATNRLTRHASSLAELRAYPVEQLIQRLSGLPRAAHTVERLRDDAYLLPLIESADSELEVCRKKRIDVLSAFESRYPHNLRHLEDRDRPAVIYAFGSPPPADSFLVAILGSSPIEPPGFERAQALVDPMASSHIDVILGAESGFDVAVAKRAVSAGCKVHLVAHSGLNTLAAELRPTASLVVRSGGSVLSSFPLGHGPFGHDHADRSLMMAGLANATVIANDLPRPDAVSAADWALENRRATFSISADTGIPDIHVIRGSVDEEWLIAAALNPVS